MSMLFRQLRVHQVFGANTNVGKTILTTALVKNSAKNNTTYYLKPVSTGPLDDADDEHVKRYVSDVKADCLFRFSEPVSPHLAAQGSSVPSDDTFVNAVANHVRRCASTGASGHMYIETAGGVHSPTLLGTPQVDCYRPLFLPTVLVGDSKLGGISTTISAYESLMLRGYIIDAILLFRDDYYRNYEFLQPYFAERGIHLSAFEPPPEEKDVETTAAYYDRLDLSNIVQHLSDRHTQRIDELESMSGRALDSVWWPFVQHGLVQKSDVTTIDSAYSDFFSTYKSSSSDSLLEPQLDGSASWWTQALGHARTELAMAAATAAGRYGHVMFPQAVHLPALTLAETLIQKGPGKGWASRAFFSDDGSTGMEVALKMALRAYSKHHSVDNAKELGVLGIKGSYHGDTIGAMDACEAVGVFTCEWHHAKGYWFDPPTVSFQQGVPVITVPGSDERVEAGSLSWIYDVSSRLDTPLAQTYRTKVENALDTLGSTIAAVVLEPLVMGAGGMIFVDPLFQRVLVDVARDRGLLVIFDEVFVGLYRLGHESTIPLLGVHPDISVHAKILTGGLVPLAVTLASESVFKAYLGSEKADALLHGHSYTAHAVGCAVANKSLELVESLATSDAWDAAKEDWDPSVWSLWSRDFVQALSRLDTVQEVMSMGTVLAVTMRDGSGYASHSAQERLASIKPSPNDGQVSSAPGGAPFGIHFRTLGNVAYFMTSLNTSPETIRSVEDRIWSALVE